MFLAVLRECKKIGQTITFLDSAICLVYKRGQVRDMKEIKTANIRIAIVIIGILIITSSTYGGWVMV